MTDWYPGFVLLGVMARGYILTSLIWGALLVWVVDRKLVRAAGAAFAAALFTEFGIIHSVLPSAGMYLPWTIPEMGGFEVLPHRLATGYLIAGIMLLLFSRVKSNDDKANIS